jgi:hypothetical protein
LPLKARIQLFAAENAIPLQVLKMNEPLVSESAVEKRDHLFLELRPTG